MTVLRRLDCVLEPTKEKVLKKAENLRGSPVKDIEPILNRAGGQNPYAIPVAAVIGGPLYIRGVKAIPILSSLLEKGMGLGAAMALLVGASGTSIPSISIMSGIFKPRLLAILVVTIVSISIVAGYIFFIYTLAYSL